MDLLIEGEDLAKIRAGASQSAACGGHNVYCSSDNGCGSWDSCVFPTTYAGCSGGVLTFIV